MPYLKSVILALLASMWAGIATATTVLFVATSPVQPGKFVNLARLGQDYGIKVESRFAEKLPADVGGELFAGIDLVVFDAPRPHMEAFIQSRLSKALPVLEQKKIPHVWMGAQVPQIKGLPDAYGKRLHAYFVNGGRSNFQNFFASIAAQKAGKSWESVAAPIVFPASAIYHPQAPKLVFSDVSSYFQWKKVPENNRPLVVAIAMHQQYVSAEQTAFIDNMIARIEQAGAVPLVFYSPVMGGDDITRMVSKNGKTVADVVINTQIMLNPEGRRKEFEGLGLPVIQAMPYRKGDEAAWLADQQGVALMDVPFYLAQAEYAGVTDIQVAAYNRKEDDQVMPIEAQTASMVNKALRMAKLQKLPNAEKKVAVFFWNYPPGEKNLSASFMNLPRSLVNTFSAMKEAGYQAESVDENALTLRLQRLLSPFYQPANDQTELHALLREGLAERLPMDAYRRWLQSLPQSVQAEMRARWGEPEQSAMVIREQGKSWFVIPRVKLGNVSILPQAPRGERWEPAEKAIYHSTKSVPSHFYLATYFWAREQFGSDVLVHFGTHGSQEWLPGKERGLSMYDYPILAVGDVPVVYPYIVDNIGEATQAKRRGRAVIISHQTPPFAPAGLHDSLTRIHDQLHAWMGQDEGAVKEKIRAEFLAGVYKERIDKDMGWTREQIEKDFPVFLNEVHDHLHELSQTAQPMGLHTFGQGAEEKYRIATVLMMLGKPFWEALAGKGEEADEMLVGDYKRLTESTPYRRLKAYLLDGVAISGLPKLQADQLAQAKTWYRDLGASNEIKAFLSALDGQYIPTSYGGDPIKNPDALPTGRNLYGFDPSRVPTKAAWEAGKEALENLVAAHRKQTGKTPSKLTFSLWSVETMRHFGMLEAQALWALGVEPVWDAGGRVTDVKLVDRKTLGRSRIDVVLSATGLYRDHFPNVMKQLAKAVKLAAEANNEQDNPVAVNSQRITRELEVRGVSRVDALKAGQTRIFSNESGNYGTGLDDATLATDSWKGKAEGDKKLAQLYLSRMQFAYGPDEADWGKPGSKGVNLYATHLKGTDAAVLSRTSNLYGMLTTDDPFQYLGGISLAVRHLDGKAPELFISNLRGSGSGKVEGAAQFLAKELATRNFHPGYIEGIMKEGYSGTLQVLDSMNNFWGWQATAREIVRDDQWQEFVDVYVKDKHNLGLKKWFESKNPHALAQTIERMLEASRQGYWEADPKTVAELKDRYRDLAKRFDVQTDNAAFKQFVGGFGLQMAAPSAAAKASKSSQAPEQPIPALSQPVSPPPIQGMVLEKVEQEKTPDMPMLALLGGMFLLMAMGGGGWRTARQQTRKTVL